MDSSWIRMPGNAAILCLVLAIVLIAAGCTPAAMPEPTSSPEPIPTQPPKPSPTSSPTAEPTSTATPTPTETPEPSPTDLPNYKATQEALATQTAEAVIADINAKLERLDIPMPDGHLGWYQQEPITIDMDAYSDAFYMSLGEDLIAADFILKTDITWRSSEGLMTCGYMFRTEPNMEEIVPQYPNRLLIYINLA